jgi:glycosyltransferase involved in cell wall biosynthesis
MKILIVASFNSGKFNSFVTEQAEALKNEGCEIDYFGIVGKGFKGYYSNRKSYIQKIRDFQPDIVHAHGGLSGLFAVLQNEVPVVITFHNGEILAPSLNLLSSIGATRARFVVYVAEHIRQLSYYKARKYTIIPCGINLSDCNITPYEEARKTLGFEQDKKYILFGGAFDNLRKNYPLLKEAVSLLPNKDSIVCLEMKGLSRAECTLRMCACDLFALPSKSEGSPQALKEAMACNCPIIATDIADVKHLLGDIEGHYLCKFEAEDVGRKITKALEFGKRTTGRQRVVELGLTNDLVAKKLIPIYHNVLKQK